MTDPKEALKTMLQDLINDRTEQAEVTIHDYLVAKTQEISGLGTIAPTTEVTPEITETTQEE